MEWFGKENRPREWSHFHEDGFRHFHPIDKGCFQGRAVPPVEESHHIWAFLETEYEIDYNTWHSYFKTYDDELLARHRAEANPNIIFFFAESISHPNS